MGEVGYEVRHDRQLWVKPSYSRGTIMNYEEIQVLIDFVIRGSYRSRTEELCDDFHSSLYAACRFQLILSITAYSHSVMV